MFPPTKHKLVLICLTAVLIYVHKIFFFEMNNFRKTVWYELRNCDNVWPECPVFSARARCTFQFGPGCSTSPLRFFHAETKQKVYKIFLSNYYRTLSIGRYILIISLLYLHRSLRFNFCQNRCKNLISLTKRTPYLNPNIMGHCAGRVGLQFHSL